MLRLRWGLAMLAVTVVAVLGLFVSSWQSSGQTEPGPGLLDAAHIGAARAVIMRLPVLSGTTADPYDTACRAPASFCASGQLAPRVLLDEAATALTAAGAARISLHCRHSDDSMDCTSVYDVQGAHIFVSAGNEDAMQATGRTFVSIRVATEPTTAKLAIKPLGEWAGVNPFPVDWKLAASCLKPTAAGCTDYRHQRAQGAPIGVSLQQAYAVAQRSLTAAGFRIDDTDCFPPGARGTAHCLVAGARFRSPGGLDDMSAVVTISTVDQTDVRMIADVSAF